MMDSRAFLFLMICCAGVLSMDCPDEWVAFEGHCYLFYNDTGEIWDVAKHNCKLMRSHLVIIETADENNFIERTLRRQYPAATLGPAFGYWTYGNDLAAEGKWVWGDADLRDGGNRNRTIVYADWSVTQPRNDPTYNCLQLWSLFNFTWDDYTCLNKGYYICEIEESETGSIETIIG